MMNSGLDKADAALYSELAAGVSGAMFPGSVSAARPEAARSCGPARERSRTAS